MGLILKRYIRHLGGPPEDGYYSDLDEDAICRSGSEIHDTVSDPGEDENATARFQSSSPPTTPLDAPLLLRTSAYDRSSLDISLPRNLNFTELRQYPIGSAHDTRSEIWQINGLLEWKDRTHDCLWKAWGTAWKFWHLPDGPKVNLLWYNAMVEAGCSESDASHAATEVICPLEQKHVPMSRSPPDLIINGIDPVANSLWTPDPPKVEMMTNSSRGAGVNKAIVMDTKTRLIRAINYTRLEARNDINRSFRTIFDGVEGRTYRFPPHYNDDWGNSYNIPLALTTGVDIRRLPRVEMVVNGAQQYVHKPIFVTKTTYNPRHPSQGARNRHIIDKKVLDELGDPWGALHGGKDRDYDAECNLDKKGLIGYFVVKSKLFDNKFAINGREFPEKSVVGPLKDFAILQVYNVMGFWFGPKAREYKGVIELSPRLTLGGLRWNSWIFDNLLEMIRGRSARNVYRFLYYCDEIKKSPTLMLALKALWTPGELQMYIWAVRRRVRGRAAIKNTCPTKFFRDELITDDELAGRDDPAQRVRTRNLDAQYTLLEQNYHPVEPPIFAPAHSSKMWYDGHEAHTLRSSTRPARIDDDSEIMEDHDEDLSSLTSGKKRKRPEGGDENPSAKAVLDGNSSNEDFEEHGTMVKKAKRVTFSGDKPNRLQGRPKGIEGKLGVGNIFKTDTLANGSFEEEGVWISYSNSSTKKSFPESVPVENYTPKIKLTVTPSTINRISDSRGRIARSFYGRPVNYRNKERLSVTAATIQRLAKRQMKWYSLVSREEAKNILDVATIWEVEYEGEDNGEQEKRRIRYTSQWSPVMLRCMFWVLEHAYEEVEEVLRYGAKEDKLWIEKLKQRLKEYRHLRRTRESSRK